MESNVGGHGKRSVKFWAIARSLRPETGPFRHSYREDNHQSGAGCRISSHKHPLACLRQIVGGRMVVQDQEVRRH